MIVYFRQFGYILGELKNASGHPAWNTTYTGSYN
jgi:hypothetical protein